MSIEVDVYGNGKVMAERLAAFPDYLAYRQAVPQNTSAVGNGAGKVVGNCAGYIQINARVSTDIVLADTKVLSIKLQESSDDGVVDSYTDLVTIYTVTASGATTIGEGTLLASYMYNPDDEKYVRAVITTDDAAVTGNIDIFPRMIV